MKKIILALIALIVIAGGYLMWKSRVSEPALPDAPISNEIDSAIRQTIVSFGSKLKNVPLLQPKAELQPQMAAQYGQYLEPALLRKWQDDPENALGRVTSSPWPDRIEVVAVEKIDDDTYKAEGNIIEITSAGEPMNPASILPVTFTVVRADSTWLISSAEKGAPNLPLQRASVTGRWICLPHRNASGPQTLECAFGIKLDDGSGNLAVNTSLMSSYPVDFPTDTRVKVEGVIMPAGQISAGQWQRYDITGIISATSIQKVE